MRQESLVGCQPVGRIFARRGEDFLHGAVSFLYIYPLECAIFAYMKNMFLISVLIVVGTVGISAQDRVICYSDDHDRIVDMASTRTEEFMDRCLEIPFGPVPRIMSLDSIISVLPHIKVRDGYTIQCVVPCGQRWLRSGLGLSSFIYARPVDRP